MGNNKPIEYQSGEKVGECFYVKEAEPRGHRRAIFKCGLCGKEFETYIHSVRARATKSCGCYNIAQTKKRNSTHGMTHHIMFSKWNMMRERCHSPKSEKWKYYGGRGITVCDEWRNDFMAFYNHVIKLPHYGEEGYSIDRMNNNKGYEPGNIRWATISQQLRNRNPYGKKNKQAA